MKLSDCFISTNKPYQEGTVEVFRQKLNTYNVKRATLSITALGLYEAEINGNKVGDALFTPGFTYYPSHLYYQNYEVTDMLSGEDTLTVYLAQGWYCGRFTYENRAQIYGACPAVSWVLRVEDENGIHHFCSNDNSVEAVASPYEYAGFYDGEIYNENRKQEIIHATQFEGHIPDVIEEGTMLVRIREEMPIRSVMKNDNVTILDFGQNFAGIICIDPAKMKGDCLKLRHGEILNADGRS